MTVHAVIYSQPNCIKCKMTSDRLQKVMRVKHEHLFDGGNDEWSNNKIEKFREQGYKSFPVVRIYDDETGKRLGDWCDFRVDLIQKYSEMAKSNKPSTDSRIEHVVTLVATKEVNVLSEETDPEEVAKSALQRLKGDGISWKVAGVKPLDKQTK